MIIHLNNNISKEEASKLATSNNAFHISSQGKEVLITGSGVKEVPTSLVDKVDESWVFPNDMQLSSKKYLSKKREVRIGNTVIGGDTKNTVLIGGPCSVESEEQIRTSSQMLVDLGLTTLRGGCYKPRTSPYSFQGLGLEGLKLLVKML